MEVPMAGSGEQQNSNRESRIADRSQISVAQCGDWCEVEGTPEIASLAATFCHSLVNQEDGDIQMKRIVMAGAILLSSLVTFNTAVAAEQSPEQQAAAATTTRQAVFKLLSFSNGVLGGMTRGQPYDKDAAILATQRIELLAGMIPAVFAADTTALKHGGAASRASDTIWGAKADFDMLAADLAAAAVAGRALIEEKGEAGVGEAVRTIGPKCGACHDRFRLE